MVRLTILYQMVSGIFESQLALNSTSLQVCPFSFSCGMKLPLEALPPGEPSGGVVYLRKIALSPEEASRPYVFLNMGVFTERRC